MKDKNTNHTNVILNLFQDLQKNKMLKQLTATPTHTDSHVSPQLNGSLCKVQNDNTAIVQNIAKDKTVKNLVSQCPSALKPSVINLSTHRLIDFKFLLEGFYWAEGI